MTIRETHQEALAATLIRCYSQQYCPITCACENDRNAGNKICIFSKQQHAKHLLRVSSFHLSNIQMSTPQRRFYMAICMCNRSMNVFDSSTAKTARTRQKTLDTFFKFQGFCFSKVFDTRSEPLIKPGGPPKL